MYDFAFHTPPACILKAKGGLHLADAYQCSHQGIHFIAWYGMAKMVQRIKSMGLALFTNRHHTWVFQPHGFTVSGNAKQLTHLSAGAIHAPLRRHFFFAKPLY